MDIKNLKKGKEVNFINGKQNVKTKYFGRYHEMGHILSTGQKGKEGLELEFDADDYAVSHMGSDLVISALEKTKNIIENEATSEKAKKIKDIDERIEKIKNRNKEKLKNTEWINR